MTKQERLYVLKGVHPKLGPQEQLFTHSEKELAIAVAKRWHGKGWKPYLISKTYNGAFKVWYDYRTAKKPAKPVRRAA